MSIFAALLRDDQGTTLTEYSVLMTSFSIFWLAGMVAVSAAANNQLQSIFTATTGMENCPPGTSGC